MQKRLRVFAGPNGSGKSSIIESILETKVGENKKLDFGIYVNADDIARVIGTKSILFLNDYSLEVHLDEFLQIADKSGLINSNFTVDRLNDCISISKNRLKIRHQNAKKIDDNPYERIAQITADFLRKKLLSEGKKFSFETVFSHSGKVEFIKKAKSQGYKVYLYFVSTESPQINIYRVKTVRVAKNGHDVPEQKITDRYFRSMDHLFEAAQYCYQSYFFDNSKNNAKHNLFAHFKIDADGVKQWQTQDVEFVPNWFIKYYSKKTKK